MRSDAGRQVGGQPEPAQGGAPDKTDVLAIRAVRAANQEEAKDSLSSPEEASKQPEPCKKGQNSENVQEERGASPPVEPESKQEKKRGEQKKGASFPTKKNGK